MPKNLKKSIKSNANACDRIIPAFDATPFRKDAQGCKNLPISE